MKIDLISLVLGAVLGALAGTWNSYFVKRPKLNVTGHGSGGGVGEGFWNTRVNIGNQPGLIGLKIGETRIFGVRVIPALEKGVIVERSPARQCHAHLLDKRGKLVSALWWQLPGGRYDRVIDIASGENPSLMLFSRTNEDGYFVFDLEGSNEPVKRKVPPSNLWFTQSDEFVVEVLSSYGRAKKRIGVAINKGYDGRFSIEYERSGGSSF